MTEALEGPVLDPVPVIGHATQPEFDLMITTRRLEDGPRTGNRWQARHRIEDEARDLTKDEADYMAAVVRLVANHISHKPHSGTKTEIVLYEARESWWQFRLALDYHVDLAKELVMLQGLTTAARLLQMNVLDLDILCRSKSSERPNLLAEIGAQKVSRRDAKKVRKHLAPPELAAVAGSAGPRRRRIPIKDALGLVG